MSIHPLHKLINLRKSTPEGITALYLNTALRTMAVSLVGIFFPVFLFLKTQEHFGQGIKIGLYGVIIYYLLWRMLIMIYLIPTSKVLSKVGYRWSMFISSVLLILQLLLFSIADHFFWLIPFITIIHALQSSFYWLSYRSLFTKDGAMSHLGEEVGTSAIIGQIASVAGPALGGIIITLWGFSSLFIVALIVVIFSGIPFFFMQRHKKNSPATISSVISWLKVKEHRNEEISFLGRRIDEMTYGIFWPIFVFLIAGTYEKQGLVASLGLVASTVMVYLAGKIFDKKHSLGVYKFGVIISTFLWTIKAFIKTFSQLIFIEVSTGTLSPFYWVTYDSLLYERARDESDNVLTFMVSRMMMVSVSLFIVAGFALLVASYSWRFFGIFGLAAVGTLLTIFMWEGEK
jgi:MFS family permease